MIYNITDYLERSAERFPEKTAVRDAKGEYTWAQLREQSRRTATALLKTGARRGIAVYADKSFETLSVFLGAAYAGLFYSLDSIYNE